MTTSLRVPHRRPSALNPSGDIPSGPFEQPERLPITDWGLDSLYNSDVNSRVVFVAERCRYLLRGDASAEGGNSRGGFERLLSQPSLAHGNRFPQVSKKCPTRLGSDDLTATRG